MMMVMITATHGFIPFVISVAEIIQLMPSTDPMERSMFPVIKTYDCPIPTIRIGAIWRSKFPILRPEKKLGFIMPNAIHSTIRPTVTVTTWPIPRIAISFLNALCFSFSTIYPSDYPILFSNLVAYVRIWSCVASSLINSPVILPSHITMIRSLIPITSGISEDTNITPIPCAFSWFIKL